MKRKLLYKYKLTFLIIALTSNTAIADVCDIALTSGAFNTTDFAQSSRLLLRKRDDVCRSEYSSQSEAMSAGKQAGGSVGYGPFNLGLSEAKQTSSGKWSIADSKLCSASAEELDSFTSTLAKQQVADVALKAWSECIDKSNKLYVLYSLNTDGTGMTGTIYRTVGTNSGFGKITGITSSDPEIDVNCRIGTTAIDINKELNININKGKIGISCKKPADKSVKIVLNTDQGDQDWIPLPSLSEKKQTDIATLNIQLNQFKRQVSDFGEQLRRLEHISVRIVKGEAGNLSNDGGVAYCNDDEYVLNGGGWCQHSESSLLWSGPVEKGMDIWNGKKASSAGWKADCTSPAGIEIVPAGAIVTCVKK